MYFEQVVLKPWTPVCVATTLFTVVCNICMSAALYLLHTTLLEPRILRLLLHFLDSLCIPGLNKHWKTDRRLGTLTLYLTHLTRTTHVLHENKAIIIIICRVRNPQNMQVGIMNFAQMSFLLRMYGHSYHASMNWSES